MPDASNSPLIYPPPPPRPRRSLFAWFGNILVTTIVILSLALNALFFWAISSAGESSKLVEKHLSGKSLSQNKIAVVRIEGVLMEGLTGYFQKQIIWRNAKVNRIILQSHDRAP